MADKNEKKRVVIANDHGAVELKERLVKHLEARGFTVENLGVNEDTSVDYPDMAERAAGEFKKGDYEFGVVCCGTGIGISISANKIEELRCALPQDAYAAEMAKRHNNANFIAFGGRIEYKEPVEEILDGYLDAEFDGGRHTRRVEKIMALENKPTLGYC